MRFTVVYVDSADKWTVIDALSSDFAIGFHEKKRYAKAAASKEEKRWRLCLAQAGTARQGVGPFPRPETEQAGHDA